MIVLALVLLLWNFIVFGMMGIDKWKAKRGSRRISERTLLLSSFLFGSVGGYFGMEIFRHKTRHNRFRYGLPAMLIFHVVLAAAAVYGYLTFWR